MSSLEHKFYLADLERSAMNAKNLPRLPRGLIAMLLIVGLTAIVGLTTLV